MKDGIIELGTPEADNFGFTADKFFGWLWRKSEENMIIISFIESKQQGKGNVRKLIQTILDQGHNVLVPEPFLRMQEILKSMGFSSGYKNNPETGRFFVMEKSC